MLSIERETRKGLAGKDGFFLQLSHAKNLTVNVETLTGRKRTLPDDAACPYTPWLRSVAEPNWDSAVPTGLLNGVNPYLLTCVG